MIKLIFCGIILVILFKILLNVLNNLTNNIEKAIEENKYNRKIEEEKHIKEKWTNDLRNGKTVNIGIQTIQCKNRTIIINRKRFNVNDIQKVELKYEILNVWKSVLNTYMPIHTGQACFPNAQIEIKDYRMTLEQYHKDVALQQEVIKDYKDGKNSSYYPNGRQYQYKFDKNYYLSIQFKDGNHKLFKIAFCPKCDKEILNAPKEESLILELEKYIDNVKNANL